MKINFTLALLLLSLSLAVNAQNIGLPVTTTLKITFADNDAKFDPPLDTQLELDEAKTASLIYISGRTSTKVGSAADEALAFKRAAAARAYLVNLGVSPLKIMINYVSAADFIASNESPNGRLENQRVDIEMIFVPMAW